MARAAPRRFVPPVLLGSLLAAVVLLVPFERPLVGLGGAPRLAAGLVAALVFAVGVGLEPPARRRLWLALSAPLTVLALAPVDPRLTDRHVLVLGAAFVLALALPRLLARGTGAIRDVLWPERLDWVDVAYTLLSVPLAWGAFRLYFGVLSPEVPGNWILPPTYEPEATVRLFLGINAVGIWDELFFVSSCYALLRRLFRPAVANLGQSVIYTSVLWDMAFSGWGPLFVFALAWTQGAMFERSRALLWVLIVHLVVDAFLFQEIVSWHYPGLEVWWHP